MKKTSVDFLNGILIINKPSGMTSHDVVDEIRKKFHMKRVGHAGTLDPLATGVLVILVGQATKLFNEFSSLDKAYEATMTLGISTDTADTQGKIIYQKEYHGVTQAQVEEIIKTFQGEIDQVPPMVSAVKVNGKRLYQLARKGIEVERKARKINIFDIRVVAFELPLVRLYLKCSKGTYVRQIAEDVGDRLGCGGCISQIHRTQVGPFEIDQALSLEQVQKSDVISITKYRNLRMDKA